MTKDPWLEIWREFIIMDLTRKLGYFCDIQSFKIITEITTDNIIPWYIRFLGISYNTSNTYINYIQQYKYNPRRLIITYLTILPMYFNQVNKPNYFNFFFFLQVERQILFETFQRPSDKQQVPLMSKILHLEFEFGKLLKHQKVWILDKIGSEAIRK